MRNKKFKLCNNLFHLFKPVNKTLLNRASFHSMHFCHGFTINQFKTKKLYINCTQIGLIYLLFVKLFFGVKKCCKTTRKFSIMTSI